ncbi:hypothetical protein RKE30_15465 [Streptomyces sp. Li-HN-5-11]|uniref:hypothetical protein n=1 Tax=Streptomyces sp. Li-HN-5-11 TaxID=3075432 RepID=UPI0028B0877C|nr:hypothetical protein [Streptomyces sp. Li-HN-5-11]WNM31706.1 hypothetical protein RKE30_15465 [Streptomyces sp. Li-HN-5-11]
MHSGEQDGEGVDAALAPRITPTAHSGGEVVFPGMDLVIEASHATLEVTRLVRNYFAAKSEADADGMMACFSRRPFTYIDATLGWLFDDWDQGRAQLAHFMADWPEDGKSYPTKILGDAAGALVFFTDTEGLIGPSELRGIGVVDFDRHGLITRQIDYWDGRHFGIADAERLRTPADTFPADFRESTVGETAAPALRKASTQLAGALRDGNGRAAAGLFAPGVVFEDLTAHVTLVGARSIGSYLTSAAPLLPYTGAGTAIRHVVGSAAGGGYEWTAAHGPVARGVSALELDPWGRITRLTTLWDGSLVDDTTLVSLARHAVEH